MSAQDAPRELPPAASLADLEALRGRRLPVTPPDPDRLAARTAPELLAASFPPLAWVIEPILEVPGLAMIYGPTGVAKTHFMLGLSVAVAAGRPFLGWTCRMHQVVYVDGELGARRMQQRLGKHLVGSAVTRDDLHALTFITRDDQPHGVMPDLADPEAQLALTASLPDPPGLLILDNLSTLTSMLESNDAASWQPMQDLLLRLKSRGYAVIVVHHANKGGTDQAGTARRTHVLDTVLSLRPHSTGEGSPAHTHEIECHLVKGREIPPALREPFLAALTNPAGASDSLRWERAQLEGSQRASIADMLERGTPPSAIAAELHLSVATVYRRRDELIASGAITLPKAKGGRPRKDTDG